MPISSAVKATVIWIIYKTSLNTNEYTMSFAVTVAVPVTNVHQFPLYESTGKLRPKCIEIALYLLNGR